MGGDGNSISAIKLSYTPGVRAAHHRITKFNQSLYILDYYRRITMCGGRYSYFGPGAYCRSWPSPFWGIAAAMTLLLMAAAVATQEDGMAMVCAVVVGDTTSYKH